MQLDGPNFNLIHGNALEWLPTLPAGSIDLVITSPPYDNLRHYKNTLVWGPATWKPLIEYLYSILKPGGVVVWIVGDSTNKGTESGTSFKQALHAVDCGFNLYDTMIFNRATLPLTHRRYEQHFEYMFIWSKGQPNTFNGLMTPCDWAGQTRTNSRRRDRNEDMNRTAQGTINPEKLRNNIWFYGVGGQKSTMDTIAYQHPAIFPEQLAADHIYTWSNPGDVVLDPLMGSGTTGKMALLSGRKFMGSEQVLEYFNISYIRCCNALSLDN